jgi:aryl-alcohol dehydrogenase-like predicted oxidoreductase
MHAGARTSVGPPPRFTAPGGGPLLGFGTWAAGGAGWGVPDRDDTAAREAAVRHALDRGVTFFDTAPTYGDGAAEALLGRVLRGRRDAITIATKVGPRDDPHASLEASLRRLGTEYVDLVQLHEAQGGWEARLEALAALQAQGKARAIGVCNATHLQLRRAQGLAPITTYQGAYNLFDRDVEERELPLCRAQGLGFLAYRPLASGLLTGKYATSPAFGDGDHRRRIYWFRGAEFERRRRVMARLQPIAEHVGLTLAALALAWVYSQPGVSVVLAGARSAEQVDENLAGARHLTPDTCAEIDQVVAAEFPPARASAEARAQAAGWGERERFIVERLDGRTRYETIAAEWTDRGQQPMIAAQIKTFVDQLAAQGLTADG